MKTYTSFDHFFTITMNEVNSAVVDFKVYEIFATQGSDNKEILYKKAFSDVPEPVESLNEASVLMSGHIKFDGCINFKFDEHEFCMLHECGNPSDKFKAIFDKLYEMAAELMPDYRKYLV